MKLHTLVISSPDYKYLLSGFFHQWNKYCCDIPIIDTCITEKENWCKSVYKHIQYIDCSHILLSLEDYYLTGPYNKNNYNYLISNHADKYDLVAQVAYWKHYNELDYLVADNNAQYRRSLQLSIWTKDYLMYSLLGVRTPWEFELAHSNDDRKIIGMENHIFTYANLMLKGKLMDYEVNKLSKRDLEETLPNLVYLSTTSA